MQMNPFQMIRRRLRRSRSGIYGLSVATVQRIELGFYEALSDGMVDALVSEVEDAGIDFADIAADLESVYGTPYLSQAYQAWRKMRRQETGRTAQWPNLEELSSAETPIGAFARAVSGSMFGFCRDFCVQGPTVARYAEGAFEYVTAPASLRQALEDAGYPEIDRLFNMQREWIDRVR